jgi:hypothetical protein
MSGNCAHQQTRYVRPERVEGLPKNCEQAAKARPVSY